MSVHVMLLLSLFSIVQFSKPHQVHHFQITNWVSDYQCSDKRAIIAVIDKVSKAQRRTGNNAIVVHGMYVNVLNSV